MKPFTKPTLNLVFYIIQFVRNDFTSSISRVIVYNEIRITFNSIEPSNL